MPDFMEHSAIHTRHDLARPPERPYIRFDHLTALHASQRTDDVVGSVDLEPVLGKPLGTRCYWLGWSVVLGFVAVIVALSMVWPAIGTHSIGTH